MKPYAADAPVDWMNTPASDLLDRVLPAGWRDRSYSDLMRATPSDWMQWMYPQYAQQAAGAQPYAALWPYAAMQGYAAPQQYGGAPMTAKHAYDTRPGQPHHHPHGCRCPKCREQECCHPRCGHERCDCYCCIGEADFVVYARVGETRVIPITIENERRREKDITVELSPWRMRGGGTAPVEGGVTPQSFKLPACGEKEVVIGVRISEPANAGNQTPANTDTQTGISATTDGRIGERELKDVDGCLVATADLTLVGCDHRPLRIAVAILPRDCDPFRVTCGCGCC